MSKLDQAKQSARELTNAVAEQETIWAAIEATVEKLYSDKPSTSATNAQFTVNDKPHTDVLANYEARLSDQSRGVGSQRPVIK